MGLVAVNGIFDGSLPVGISALGTLVFDNIYFPTGAWVDLDNVTNFYQPVKLDAASVRVNQVKNIVKSQIAGRSGTIKEFISLGDYEVIINAIIAPDVLTAAQIATIAAGQIPGFASVTGALGFTGVKEPTLELYRIKQLCAVQDRVQVYSKFLQNVFEINYLVIEDYELSRLAADSWALKMSCVSDFDVDLKEFG